MKTILAIAVVLGTALAADQKIKLEDMPPAVQQAVKEQSQGATVRGYSKEVEKGKTSYEAELTVNGHAKDISFDASGKVVAVEEEVPLESIPAPSREAIQKAAGTGKIKKVDAVTEKGAVSYEAAIARGGKNSEVRVDAAGKILK
jgi:uncharacterized membrane protein YkoI